MKKEFVLRGQTESGKTEKLSFSGHKMGYAYRLVEFDVYPSTGIGSNKYEICATITASKTAVQPTDPNFKDEGLIATAYVTINHSPLYPASRLDVINDTFMITQDLILMVEETDGGRPVNWQCRFESVKMSGPEETVTNYKQFMISDGSS